MCRNYKTRFQYIYFILVLFTQVYTSRDPGQDNHFLALSNFDATSVGRCPEETIHDVFHMENYVLADLRTGLSITSSDNNKLEVML